MAPRAATLPLLTRAETEVMGVLWSKGAGTVHDVASAVGRELAYTTVLTMLRVLEQKGYLAREPNPEGGRAHMYRPTVTEAGARKSHLRDFVDRLFGGRPEELVIGLLRDEQLSRADLELLRGEIDAKLAASNTSRTSKTKSDGERGK